MPSYNLLEVLSGRVLGVNPGADEDEIRSAFQDKVTEWHPDVSDDPDAQDKFQAANTARDILLGEFNFGDPDRVNTAEGVLKRLFTEDELQEASRETSDTTSYRSAAQKRTDPDSYDVSDFMGMSGDERQEMIQRVALGVETTLVYQAVQGLYVQGYNKDDFFTDVNDYIGEAHPNEITFDDYWEATNDNVRANVSRDIFIESMEKVQAELQQEYGDGASLREVARIVAYFMVEGGINVGAPGRMVGDSRFGKDARFSRGGRGSSRFGRDSRFDR